MLLEFDDVRSFCLSREIDLVMVPPPAPFVVCLRGEFNGYGDFFSLMAAGVEYLEIPGGLTIGDLVLVQQIRDLAALSSKWSWLDGVYSGPALAMRAADASRWGTGVNDFVLVANHIEWHSGSGWAGRNASRGSW